jgi:hypothetical protein
MKVNNKPHFCKSCEETNPENFYPKDKGKCKKCQIEKAKKWKTNNIEKVKISNRKYAKNYYYENTEQVKNTTKEWRYKNKEHLREYYKNKIKNDVGYKIRNNIRKRHKRVLFGIKNTTKYLGCDKNFFRDYIESLWEPWMNWNNYGNKEGFWSLEHIIPLNFLDIDDTKVIENEKNKKILHYTNIKPLLHLDNVKKGDKINEKDLVEFLERVI